MSDHIQEIGLNSDNNTGVWARAGHYVESNTINTKMIPKRTQYDDVNRRRTSMRTRNLSNLLK